MLVCWVRMLGWGAGSFAGGRSSLAFGLAPVFQMNRFCTNMPHKSGQSQRELQNPVFLYLLMVMEQNIYVCSYIYKERERERENFQDNYNDNAQP